MGLAAGQPQVARTAPLSLGQDRAPWYRDIPSLLSVAQTEQTLTKLATSLHAKPPKHDTDVSNVDTGEQFRCVSAAVPAKMYRWLADGSRVYEGEVNGVLAPPLPLRINNAVGDRHPNAERLLGLDFIVRKIEEDGAKVIVYSSPVHPRSYDDPKQARAIEAFGAAVRAVTDRHGVDYCGLAMKANEIGCLPSDFADELHISRHCNERIVRELALGCAPRAGPLLRAKLNPDILK